MMTTTIKLPPLDGFTREELEELIRVLHGGLVRAQADYDALSSTAWLALDEASRLVRT